MSLRLAPDHPKQKLLFFVASEIDERLRDDVSRFILRLAGLRHWVNGPPRFVRESEPVNSPIDTPVETLGGYLDIYTTLPPWVLPREIDLQHFDEVTTLVNALRHFSQEHAVSIEFELDGQYVGSIKEGEPDRSLSDGLLAEWKRHLGV